MPLDATLRTQSCGGVIYRRIAVQVKTDITPIMGFEHFGAVQLAKPGGHVVLSQAGSTACCIVPNPRFDSDDRLLPFGESYCLSLVGQALPLE